MKAKRHTPEHAGHGGAGENFASLHLWQIQAIRDVAVIGSLFGIVYLGYLMRVVTVPLLVGLLLAYLFKPLIDRMSVRLNRGVSTAIVIAVMYIAIGVPLIAATGVAAVQGTRFVHELRQDWPVLVESIEGWIKRWERYGRTGEAPAKPADAPPGAGSAAPTSGGKAGSDASLGEPVAGTGAPAQPQGKEGEAKPDDEKPVTVVVADAVEKPGDAGPTFSLKDIVASLLGENSGAIGRSIAGGGRAAFEVGWIVLGTAGFLAFNVFFLIPFFFYFCSVGFGSVQRLGVSLIPRQNRERTMTIVRKMDGVISGFVRGRVIIAAILGVLFTIGWWIVGVPAPLIIGPITGALAVVPYLALVGWPTSVIALWVAQSGGAEQMPTWQILLYPSIVYWSVQTIDDYVLTPLIQGKQVGLDAPMILVAVLGAAAVAGVYGVLVAIPAAACIKILVTDVMWPRYRQWAEGKVEDPLPIPKE